MKSRPPLQKEVARSAGGFLVQSAVSSKESLSSQQITRYTLRRATPLFQK